MEHLVQMSHKPREILHRLHGGSMGIECNSAPCSTICQPHGPSTEKIKNKNTYPKCTGLEMIVRRHFSYAWSDYLAYKKEDIILISDY